MTFIVCPLRYLPQVIAERAPSHLITLLSPDDMIDTPQGIEPRRHLRLAVHDIPFPQPRLVAPDAATVEQILEFGRGWDASQPMAVHCLAGISRSTAAAFVLACERNPHADEYQIAMMIRRASPAAFPNRRIVALADDILGRDGRLLDAVEAMGGTNFISESEPFDLPSRH
ncbi:MAG: tyrosine phosphatase family protein [Caulobacterales bacterium]